MITKEGIQVEVGQVWRDLDKRMKNRRRKIIRLLPATGRVLMAEESAVPPFGLYASKVSVSRMHKHSTGWELVTQSIKAPEHG